MILQKIWYTTDITFLNDDRIIAKVCDDKNQIEFESTQYSITALAKKILIERYGWSENLSINGWRFFRYNGMALSDQRDRQEGISAE